METDNSGYCCWSNGGRQHDEILPAKAEEKTRYPYTIFASAQTEGAITINADNFCLNGDMVTNGTISASGNLQINGTKKESAEESMMYLFHAIDDAYFTDTDYVACEGDYVLEETNINISIFRWLL